MNDEERPFEGGAQPVRETPPEVPTSARSAGQYGVLILAAVVVLAAVFYVVARFAG